ncbi:FAD-binding oxidoreductase [Cereibacter sphaeroides]|uniref:NAD(P)/FAD-dependent oxidoreductase n=1 Tax=Cereibacter sphaeroides TaxID=1063 RepID=UPI001F264DA8|nr:FAD-dependent oxidoreductase [Cereibacter sphaeroides]MCE6950723.1 FAD-binding oxidoreductase [Cereibacter sphaeroides]
MVHDFLIIGGGIAGISAAARLSELGSVLLLEAEDSLAHHASSRSAALYEPRYGLAPVVELSLASAEFYHRAEGILSPRGMMVVARADDAAQFEAEAEAMQLDRLTPEEAREIVPVLAEDVTLAAHADHAWDIDTDLLLQRFGREARQRGATFRTRAPVTAIVREGGFWSVTAGERHHARVIVNAAGAWVDRVAEMAGVRPIGFTPYRRSVARIPAPEGRDVSRWPMIFGTGEGWYAKPDAGALIVSPAEEHPMEPHDAWADDMVLAEGLARYEEMVTTPVTRLIASWAGLRTFAPDRVLVIGRDPAEPSFFWLAGQGGYGFQTCPAASRLAADLLGERPPEVPPALVSALAPARFG